MSDITIQRIRTLTSLQILEEYSVSMKASLVKHWWYILSDEFSLRTIHSCRIDDGIRLLLSQLSDSDDDMFILKAIHDFYRNILIAVDLFLPGGRSLIKLQEEEEEEYKKIDFVRLMVA